MEIPRIIHQIWIQGQEAVPGAYRRWAAGWRARHPGWEYVLWDDAALRGLLGAHVPELLPVYRQQREPEELSDLGRYAVLHVHGGLYVDMDTESVRPIEPLLAAGAARVHVATYSFPRFASPHSPYDWIANSLIACTPRHPLWPGFFDLLCRTCSPGTFTPANTGPEKLWPYLQDWARTAPGDLRLIAPQEVLISYLLPRLWMRLAARLSPRLCVLDFNASGRRRFHRLRWR